jgi:uncharacterized SAM-binding protein YcdF (DUF218 family)
VFEPLVEPVALIGWLLLGAALWYGGPRRRAAVMLLGCLLLYLAFATPLGANALLRPLENHTVVPPACSVAPAVIVVLAGGAHGAAESARDLASLSEASFRRAAAAADLALAEPQALLLVAGRGVSVIGEARLMAALIERLGIAPERIVVENESRTTAASAAAIAALLAPRASRRVRLVTSAAHMWRASRLLERRGLEVCPVAVDRGAVTPGLPGALIPQISALEKSTSAIHEYEGLVADFLFGA